MQYQTHNHPKQIPWNKGKLTGQKPPLKLHEIWEIRIRLQIAKKSRDLALFNLAIDSKLRSCDLVNIKVRYIAHGKQISKRAIVMQQKTHEPVQFEITKHTREALTGLIESKKLISEDYLFQSSFCKEKHISTRQYARILNKWVTSIGLNPHEYGTHSLRRSKVSLIYKRTKNLRAIQLLLGHKNLESTVQYLGIEVDDALEMAENTDI